MTDRLHKPWFSFGIGVIHQVAGLLLVIFATWFLAACATATVGFNYMLPAVAIRALALTRIASGYGHLWWGHQQLFARLRQTRTALFARLKNTILTGNAELETQLEQDTLSIAGAWVNWLVQHASVIIGLLLCQVIIIVLTPHDVFIWGGFALTLSLVWAMLLWQSYAVVRALVSTQTALRDNINHTLNSASLWHLYAQVPTINPSQYWLVYFQLQGQVQRGIVFLLVLTSAGLVYTLTHIPDAMLGNALLVIPSVIFLAAQDWAVVWFQAQPELLTFQQSHQRLQQTPGVELKPDSNNELSADEIQSIQWSEISLPYSHKTCPDINLRKGIPLWITGSSGVGKSSLLEIMQGMYPKLALCQTNGRKLREGFHDSWQLVQQHPTLMYTSLADNLRMGDTTLTDEQLQQMLCLVGLDKLTNQLHSWVGGSARQLSGGEIKRFALARALLRRPEVLFLDEPFEGLDSQNQMRIYALISDYATHHCVVVATHLFPMNVDQDITLNLDDVI
jgi:ATP-binding cassette subfamily C protein CydC